MTTSNKMRIDLDPRIIANQTKILKYLSHITEEQKAQRQTLRMLTQETQKFQGDVYQTFKILDHKIQQMSVCVDNVEETSEHVNIRVKSIYKHMKGVGSNSDLLHPESQPKMLNSFQRSIPRQHTRQSNDMTMKRQGHVLPPRGQADFNLSGSDIDANEHVLEEDIVGRNNLPFSNLSDLSKPLNSPVQKQRVSSKRTSKQRQVASSNIVVSDSLSSLSPVPIADQPPQNTHRPITRKQGYTQHSPQQDFIDTSVIKRAPRTKKRLIEANPRETDVERLAENNGFELSKASIRAISEACKSSQASQQQTVGLHTVLVLDTSASMEGHSLNTLKTFVNGMLDGIDSSAGELGLEEHIAIVTCGSSVQIQQRFTNDYMAIRNTIDNLSSQNGRTPLVGALTLALCYLEIKGETMEMNSHRIPPRVVIVSDFHVTSDNTFVGQDSDTSEVRIHTQKQIIQLGQLFMRSGYPIYCVPVRDSNHSVCEGLANTSGGLVIPVSEPMMCAHYYRYQLIIGSVIERFNLAMSSGNEEDLKMLISEYLPKASLTENDHDGVYKLFYQIIERTEDNGDLDELSADIDLSPVSSSYRGPRIETPVTDEEVDPTSLFSASQAQARKVNNTQPRSLSRSSHRSRSSPRSTGDVESSMASGPASGQESSDSDWTLTPGIEKISFEERADLPMIGTRVVRGKNWKWGNQDGNGLGTIVGHNKKGLVFILWDNTNGLGCFRYRYEGNNFDVEVRHEPRQVPEGSIEIGCWVVRGPDWTRGDEDGGDGTVGVVIRKMLGRKVMVRWPSRVIETYNCGADNKWDLKVTMTKPLRAFEEEPPGDVSSQEGSSVSVEEEMVPCWFWMDSSSQWRIFPEVANKKLEDTYTMRPQSNVMVHRKDQSVKVFLGQMLCEINGRRCKIDRTMKTESEIKSLNEIEGMLPDP